MFLVRQGDFEGTLSELAHALRRGVVAPEEVDLPALVRSYLEHFDSLSTHDLELASVALPNVAQVIELKLRMLLPRPPREEDEADGVLEEALEAVAILEELEEAIDFLRQRRDERRIVLPASTPRPEYPRKARPSRAGIDRLAQLATRYRSSGYFEMAVERLTIRGAISDLLASLRRWGRMMLHETPERPDWSRMTVFFAGMLELVREGRVRARQETPYAEIELHLVEPEAPEVAADVAEVA